MYDQMSPSEKETLNMDVFISKYLHLTCQLSINITVYVSVACLSCASASDSQSAGACKT